MLGLPIWMWLLIIVFGSYGMMYLQSLQNQDSKSDPKKPTMTPSSTPSKTSPTNKEKYSNEEEPEQEQDVGVKEEEASYQDRLFVIRSFRAFLDRMPTDEEIKRYAGKPDFLHVLADKHGLKQLSEALRAQHSGVTGV